MNASELLQDSRNRGTHKSIQEQKKINTDLSPKAFFGSYNKVRGAYEVKTYKGSYLPKQNTLSATPGIGGKADNFRLSFNSSEITFPRKIASAPEPDKEIKYTRPAPSFMRQVGATISGPNFYDYTLPSVGNNTSLLDGISRVLFSDLINFRRRGRGTYSPAKPLELSFAFNSSPGPRGGAHGIVVSLIPLNFQGSGFSINYSDLRTLEEDPPRKQKKPNPSFDIRENEFIYSDQRTIPTGSTIIEDQKDKLKLPLSVNQGLFRMRYDGQRLSVLTPSGPISANISVGGSRPLDFMALFIARPFFPTAGLTNSQVEAFRQDSRQVVLSVNQGPFTAVGPNNKWRDRRVNIVHAIARGRR